MKQTISMLSVALLLSALAFPSTVVSGEGHDHGDEAPAASNANAPKRLPDGDVFLPKQSQRQLGVRTVVATQASLPKTLELSGRVVMDPNAGGRVQASIAGRVEAGPKGFPALGQTVRKGEVLAVVRASASPIDRANQVAQGAELRAQLDLAKRRAARFAQLEGSIAQKDRDAAQSDVFSLEQRVAAVQASVSATESLVAPVAGVVSASNAVAGQVIEARELLFEIIDPARLTVEASAFDASLIGNIAAASVGAPGSDGSIPLQFAGAGRSLREGAIPLQFRATGKSPLPLAVNQPVKVIVQTKEQVQGFAVPASALAKNPSNQDIVWVHTGAEVFAPRTVRSVALDGARVSVLDGLKAGDRVVMQGAALINQVR